ncbi:unnamed protein product [Phaeothamnion confervicola]
MELETQANEDGKGKKGRRPFKGVKRALGLRKGKQREGDILTIQQQPAEEPSPHVAPFFLPHSPPNGGPLYPGRLERSASDGVATKGNKHTGLGIGVAKRRLSRLFKPKRRGSEASIASPLSVLRHPESPMQAQKATVPGIDGAPRPMPGTPPTGGPNPFTFGSSRMYSFRGAPAFDGAGAGVGTGSRRGMARAQSEIETSGLPWYQEEDGAAGAGDAAGDSALSPTARSIDAAMSSYACLDHGRRHSLQERHEAIVTIQKALRARTARRVARRRHQWQIFSHLDLQEDHDMMDVATFLQRIVEWDNGSNAVRAAMPDMDASTTPGAAGDDAAAIAAFGGGDSAGNADADAAGRAAGAVAVISAASGEDAWSCDRAGSGAGCASGDADFLRVNAITIPDADSAAGLEYKLPRGPLTEETALSVVEALRQGGTLTVRGCHRILREYFKVAKALPNVCRCDVPVPAAAAGAPGEDGTGGGRVTVVGDLHGQLADLYSVLRERGYPSATNRFVFNGDFVDRGPQGVEVVLILFSFALVFPEYVFLNRGNHEDFFVACAYGFQAEVRKKYDDLTFSMFVECFRHIPIATIVADKVFVVHGGLFHRRGVTIDTLQKIPRYNFVPQRGLGALAAGTVRAAAAGVESSGGTGAAGAFEHGEALPAGLLVDPHGPPSAVAAAVAAAAAAAIPAAAEGPPSAAADASAMKPAVLAPAAATPASPSEAANGGGCGAVSDGESESVEELIELMRDGLWSDPWEGIGLAPNPRGAGVLFDEAHARDFLERNGLEMVFRSHECVPEGWLRVFPDEASGCLCTVFSASNYGLSGNKGATATFSWCRRPGSMAVRADAERVLWFEIQTHETSESVEEDLMAKNELTINGLVLRRKGALREAFQAADPEGTGRIGKRQWGEIMSSVVGIPAQWLLLLPVLAKREHMVGEAFEMVDYNAFLRDCQSTFRRLTDHQQGTETFFDALYVQKDRLRALFHFFDRDGDGVISHADFQNGCMRINSELPPERRLMRFHRILELMNFTRGSTMGVDINEFFEAFRHAALLTMPDGHANGGGTAIGIEVSRDLSGVFKGRAEVRQAPEEVLATTDVLATVPASDAEEGRTSTPKDEGSPLAAAAAAAEPVTAPASRGSGSEAESESSAPPPDAATESTAKSGGGSPAGASPAAVTARSSVGQGLRKMFSAKN